MMLGFWIARKAPVWASVGLVIVLEVVVVLFIRDNLTLNILMLIHPFEAIKRWQSGGSILTKSSEILQALARASFCMLAAVVVSSLKEAV